MMSQQGPSGSTEGILTGVKVVEYAASVPGPYCAKILADAGADVLKVEPPEGDVARQRGPFPDDLPDPNKSGLFLFLNANKRGITLDITKGEGLAVFRELVRRADILIENHPPAEAEGLGIAFPALQEVNTGLIVTSVTRFGQWGPYQDHKADDHITWAMGGMAWATPGLPDRATDGEREPPLHPDAPAADIIAGAVSAAATLLALMAREGDGAGRHVDTSAQEAVAAMAVYEVAPWSYGGLLRGRLSETSARQPNIYLPCKDGHVVITAMEEDHWQELCRIMGQPGLAELEVFKDSTLRANNWDALEPILLEFTMAHSGRELEETLQTRGVPCMRAYTIGEAVSSDQVRTREALWAHDVDGRTALLPAPPYRYSHTPLRLRRPAPRLGEHTAEVLGQAGYTPEEIARLKAAGVI